MAERRTGNRRALDPRDLEPASDPAFGLLLRSATAEHYADPALYDHEYRRRRADVNYYRALARQTRADQVLELGCGSGRLLVPLARDGVRVVGLDLSQPMLRRCAERIARLPTAARVRARIVRADFRGFALGRRFPLIVCPFNAMMHLYTRDDVERFLACVRAHLAPGGLFAFDVIHPDLKWLMRDPEKRWARTRFKDPESGRTFFYSTNTTYDPVTQIAWIRLFYDEEIVSRGPSPVGRSQRAGSRGRRLPPVVHLAQRQFFPQELLALLHYNGFSVEGRDGGFAGEPFEEGCESQVCRCSIKPASRR
jgi:SAM-dependent methyltransferase